LTSAPPPRLRERIEKGEAFDLAILTDDAVDALIKAGKISPMQRARLARVGIGVGYRKGAAKPDISTAAGIKQSLLNAKSIAYTEAGASRPGIDRMFERLGIAGQIKAKSHLTAAGAAPSIGGEGRVRSGADPDQRDPSGAGGGARRPHPAGVPKLHRLLRRAVAEGGRLAGGRCVDQIPRRSRSSIHI
jgi:hypothetical protein